MPIRSAKCLNERDRIAVIADLLPGVDFLARLSAARAKISIVKYQCSKAALGEYLGKPVEIHLLHGGKAMCHHDRWHLPGVLVRQKTRRRPGSREAAARLMTLIPSPCSNLRSRPHALSGAGRAQPKNGVQARSIPFRSERGFAKCNRTFSTGFGHHERPGDRAGLSHQKRRLEWDLRTVTLRCVCVGILPMGNCCGCLISINV